MANAITKIDYICPLTREVCINLQPPKENPFTGNEMHEECAWGTKDGSCAVARLISAMTADFTRGRY